MEDAILRKGVFMTEVEVERIRQTLTETRGKDIKERFKPCVTNAEYKYKSDVMPEMIRQMMEDEEDRSYIFENMDHVLEDFFYNGSTLVRSGFMKRMYEYSPEEYKKYYPRFIEFMFRNKIFDSNDNLVETITLDEEMTDKMGRLLEEIAAMQGLHSSDVEWAGSGKYSIAYKIGEKVIKLGRERLSDTVPDHPCVVKPMYDKKVVVDAKKGTEEHLEVEDYLRPLEKYAFKENDGIVLDLFTKLRKAGWVWVDSRPDNVGKTKSGMCVILDRDAIYPEDYFEEHKAEIGKKLSLGNFERFEKLRLAEKDGQVQE